MTIDENRIRTLEQKLDLVAHLLLLTVQPSRIPATKEQIRILHDHGLSPSQIGDVIGRKANYVSAVMKALEKRNEI